MPIRLHKWKLIHIEKNSFRNLIFSVVISIWYIRHSIGEMGSQRWLTVITLELKHVWFRVILMQELCYWDHQWESTIVVFKLFFCQRCFWYSKENLFPLSLSISPSSCTQHFHSIWGIHLLLKLKHILRIKEPCYKDLLSYHLSPHIHTDYHMSAVLSPASQNKRGGGTGPEHLGQILFMKGFTVKLLTDLFYLLKERGEMLLRKHH